MTGAADRVPPVAIGLPVYNGENYLAEAIQSILDQTFTDFRLIISDNCSTDATQEICRSFAKQDDRITCIRQSENIGGAPNYNAVFQPEGAKYFKWAAHDDVLEPRNLELCYDLLETRPDAVIAHGRTNVIDGSGKIFCNYDNQVCLADDDVPGRFWRILWAYYFTEVFGLMRTDAIKATRMHGSFAGSDRNFMAEMLMQGTVAYVPDFIFRRRDHEECYVRAKSDSKSRQTWFDPSKKFVMPNSVVKTRYYAGSIARSQMSLSDRLRCLQMLTHWTYWRAVKGESARPPRPGRRRTAANPNPKGRLTTFARDILTTS